MGPLVPYRPDAEIRAAAAGFLATHHPSGAIPVPIEEIVEFSLGLEIMPIPGLTRAHAIDAYLSADRRSICVDDGLMMRQVNRYRFSLAHEVGHLLMHADVFGNIASEAQWIEFHARLSDSALKSAEIQADIFAGLVLVPPSTLARVAAEEFHRVREVVISQVPGIEVTSDTCWGVISEQVARRYEVSGGCAERRLRRDAWWGRMLP